MEKIVTYQGYIQTSADAIKLFEACRLGLLPRIQRRLSTEERQLITSGSVFVWDEQEAMMRRWTDGKLWSGSRVWRNFFLYREIKGKNNGAKNTRDINTDEKIGSDGLDGSTSKPDRLMKQLYNVTTSTGNHLHLISYYSQSHLNSPKLPRPTTDPNLRHIVPTKGMYIEDPIRKSPEPVLTRALLRLSPYGQPSHKQIEIYGSRGRRRRALPSHGYAQACRLPQSPIDKPSQPYKSPYPPLHRSEYTPIYQNHDQPHQLRPLSPKAHRLALLPQLSLSEQPGLSNTLLVNQPNSSPRVEQSTVTATQHVAYQLAIAERALESNIVLDQNVQYPLNLLPPLHQLQGLTTPEQQHLIPLSLNSFSKSNVTISQAQNAISISNLIHTIDSDLELSRNDSTSRSGLRSESPIEMINQRLEGIPLRKPNTWVVDEKAIRILDQNFVF